MIKRAFLLSQLASWGDDLQRASERPCAPNNNVYEDFESGFREEGSLDVWADVDKKAMAEAEAVSSTAQEGQRCLRFTATTKGWGSMIDIRSHYGGKDYQKMSKLVFWAKSDQDLKFTAGFGTWLRGADKKPQWDIWPNGKDLKASPEWQKIEIPLEEFKDQAKNGDIELNKVRTFRFYLPGPGLGAEAIRRGVKELKGVTVYLDHFYFQ